MPRVCVRTGCGQPVAANAFFCGAECRKNDKREKLQAKRAGAKKGRCPTCGTRQDKVMKRPKTLWLNVERIGAADGKMQVARIGVVTATELDLVLQQIAATRAKLPVNLPVDETRKLRIVPVPEAPRALLRREEAARPIRPTRRAVQAHPETQPKPGPQAVCKTKTRGATAAISPSSRRAGSPKHISIAPAAKPSGKPGKGKG